VNSIALDTLFLRRPKLNYVSPPVCEAVFSGTGSPIIILPDIGPLLGPTGIAVGGSGQITLRWNNYPGALCYNVYSAIFTGTVLTDCEKVTSFSLSAQYKLVAECVHGTSFDLTVQGCYRISAITGEGETDLSNPICTACYTPACPFGSIWNPLTFQCETCQFPVCPPGYVPNGVTCGCSPCGAQPCPPGFTVNPASPCDCVPCGMQTCPQGYVISLSNSCNCVPESGPFEVCNDDQTASCTPPEVGDPVTVPAGTYCTFVNTAPEVAGAKAAMNAQALADANDQICCADLDWSHLLWGSSSTTFTGTGAGGFTPQNAESATFSGQSSTTASINSTSSVSTTSTLLYSGPQRLVHINVTVGGTGLKPGTGGGSSGSIEVLFNGVATTILIDGFFLSSAFVTTLFGVGNHVIEFTVPDTCETPLTLGLRVNTAAGNPVGITPTCDITLSGTVVNV
jgi:hypothetical protein